MKIIMVMLAAVSCAGCREVSGCKDDIQELRETQAIQKVQLQDARDRIKSLETDLDRIAPHRWSVAPVDQPRP
jgi:hypothetical protein